jgi:hypothetical protein
MQGISWQAEGLLMELVSWLHLWCKYVHKKPRFFFTRSVFSQYHYNKLRLWPQNVKLANFYLWLRISVQAAMQGLFSWRCDCKRSRILRKFHILYNFQSLRLQDVLLRCKSRFNFHPVFFTFTIFCACNTPHEIELFLRHSLPPGGEERGGDCIVTAICNCRPVAIVDSILATVAAYLHPPPPGGGSRSLFSISQTRCSRGLDPGA